MARLLVGAIVLAVLAGCATPPAPPAEHAQAPRSRSATFKGKSTPLLGGRLVFRMPDGARIEARRTSIMAAKQSVDEETRVLLVPGQGDLARFVMIAREMFALGTGDAVADLKKLGDAGDHAKVEPLVTGPGLHVAAVVPGDQRPDSPLCVLLLLVEQPDHTALEVAFFVLPEMAGERAQWTDRAKAIARTLTLGERKVALESEHRIDLGGERVLVVRTPAPSVVTHQPGPDFLVVHLRMQGRLGDPAAAMGFYVGGYPSYQFEQAGVPAAQVQQLAGKLLGHDVHWMRWSDQDVVMLEAMTKLDAHEVLHVFVHGTAADAAALRSAAEHMTLTGH